MKLFSEYRGLRKEIYILFFGRVVTNMGALIWPMITLILSNKMNMSASMIANILLIMGVVSIPCVLISGKLVDRFNKRNIIIVCDLITVGCYLIAGFMPMSIELIGLFFVAGLFAQMEWPAYDALVADLTSSKDRERAYSLSYLGSNLGLVLAPTIGGLLFKNHLNIAFIISGLSTLCSTILIFLFIKNVTRIQTDASEVNLHEIEEENKSIFSILKERKIILLFIAVTALSGLVYSQFNYLMPLNLEALYGEDGALIFGTLTSVNAFVVIVGTPIITKVCRKIKDVSKLSIGELLVVIGYSFFAFVQGILPIYFLAIVIFTIGEIFQTLGKQPYITKRIPASHRGRMASILSIFVGGFQAIAQKGIGFIIDTTSMSFTWIVVICMGCVAIIGFLVLKYKDKIVFSSLHKENSIWNQW